CACAIVVVICGLVTRQFPVHTSDIPCELHLDRALTIAPSPWTSAFALRVYHVLVYSVCFFFFQAEDGIRDWSVTGVQTCALPICDMSTDVDLLVLGGGMAGLSAAAWSVRQGRSVVLVEKGELGGSAARAGFI